jgi:hypothetical protein
MTVQTYLVLGFRRTNPREQFYMLIDHDGERDPGGQSSYAEPVAPWCCFPLSEHLMTRRRCGTSTNPASSPRTNFARRCHRSPVASHRAASVVVADRLARPIFALRVRVVSGTRNRNRTRTPTRTNWRTHHA